MNKNQGFTLIELLVVVLIIGILSALALPQYEKAVEKSRAAEAFAMMRGLSAGFEEYVLANGTRPTSFDELSVTPPNLEIQSDGCFHGSSFRFCIQNSRLQSWSLKKSSYGFIWYPSNNNVGVSGKQLYCFVRRDSAADTMGICKLIGGKDKITSPTDSNYDWYALD